MEPGEQIGDYIIVRQIGEGGMSVVYLAEHKELGTQAVVKRLRQQLALDEQLVKYFVQGARIMQQLRHPHLAAVYDYIEHDDRYFMVEEYLSGGSLADLLTKGESIPEKEALRWCRDALRAVDYAHQNGILHRDLKPGNLMLDQEREVKVTDFGIAKVFGGPRLTKTGDEKGTPLYMSPEQIRTPDKVDHSTDVYSMGVVLYELLTHRVPFDSESEFDIKQAVVREPPVPPRQLNRSISRDAERIVLKALQKRPENRFSGCGEFALHIDRCLSPGKGQVWNPLEWIKQHRRIAAGLLVLLLALILAPRIREFLFRDGDVIATPTVELVAKPMRITSGQEATLEWKVQNARKVRIEPDLGEVPAIGSRRVAPTKSVSYVITATGPGGSVTDSVHMIVSPVIVSPVIVSPVPIPIIEIAASHAVTTPGHPTVLKWKVRNADTVRIEPGIGDVPATGSRTVIPTKSVSYVLTAKGPGGSVSAKVDIVVEPAPVTAPSTPTVALVAKPEKIKSGQTIQLEWKAQNANQVRIEPGIGEVPMTGSRTVTPTTSVTYVLTAKGSGGTASAKVDIVVEPAPVPPTVVLVAKPERIKSGQLIQLEWKAQNANQVRIEPEIGDVQASGVRTVAPTKSATYTVTATGPGGSVSAKVDIEVEATPVTPTIVFVAKPEKIKSGQATHLEWKAENASQVRIEPVLGEVPVTGSRTVAPTESVTFVATATGPGGKASARAVIVVEPRAPSLKARSGTIIWSGQVNRDEQIIIDGNANGTLANIGSVQGSLPGVPCIIDISDREGAAVVEPPGPRNGFNRIVLRSNRKGRFSVTINWKVLN